MNTDQLKAALGPGGWIEGDSDTQRYRTDWRGTTEGSALGVARPDSTQAVAEVVRIASEAGIAIVPQGGNTGLVLGSIPTEEVPSIVLTLERMNRIRDLDAANFALVAESGCIIHDVQQAARAAGRQFGLSLASEGSSTVGGTVSTNAGGNQTIRFGNARDQVLGLEVVLANGTVLDGLSTLRKNNTGYDLKQLFIGAEGTLGVVTAAALRLLPAPVQTETAWLAVPTPHAALALLGAAREMSGDQLLAFELMPRYAVDLALAHIDGVADPLATTSPWYVLMEMATSSSIDDLSAKLEQIVSGAMDQGTVTDGVVAHSETQRLRLWRLREEQAEAGKRAGPAVSGDVSVPVGRVADFLEASRALFEGEVPGVGLNTFGHMGDGNIHYGMRKPPAMSDDEWTQRSAPMLGMLNRMVADYGGSFSAEHGIGAQKRATLGQFASPAKLALMRTVKQALDPTGLMNPGKIF